ncbi:hypothetical protein ACHAXR_007645 [Thalassiosira sp. AJA248-18]
MVDETAKRRKREIDDEPVNDTATPEKMMLAEMKSILDERFEQMAQVQNEHMKTMQGEVDVMKQRISHVDELEAKCQFLEAKVNSMKSEMDTMKRHLSHIGELENKFDTIKGRLSHVDQLEKSCQLLEDRSHLLEARSGSLERSLQVLIKHNKWEYSAPPITPNYWGGFDVHYIAHMDFFLQEIKGNTCELRHGKYGQYICFSGGNDHEDERTSVLLHDDIILPHWREFADALQMYQRPLDNDASGTFSVSNIQLTSAVVDMLAPALVKKNFRHFELDHNMFPNIRDGIEFACKFAKSNPNLDSYQWLNNPIGCSSDLGHLLDAINGLPSLERIGLSRCCGRNLNGYSTLRSIITGNQYCEDIDLSSNNIRTMGSTHLPDFLATNPPLKYMNLENNHLNDNDAELIAASLIQNCNLESLSLEGNEITSVGCDALRHVVFDSTSLNSVADSNHSCYIGGLDFGGIPNNWNNSKRNRRMKIYYLLSSRNREGSNAHHLDSDIGEESLKLAPEVLQCVNHCSGCEQDEVRQDDGVVKPLSIIYEILRNWRMPSLYEIH